MPDTLQSSQEVTEEQALLSDCPQFQVTEPRRTAFSNKEMHCLAQLQPLEGREDRQAQGSCPGTTDSGSYYYPVSGYG